MSHVAELVRCGSCGELLPCEEVTEFMCLDTSTIHMMCDYCLREESEKNEGATVKQNRFASFEYTPGDLRAHRRLESAVENLHEAVVRCLRNCPDTTLILRTVNSAIKGAKL